MKIEKLTKDSYRFIINKEFCKNVNLEDKEEIINFIKEMLLKKKRNLNLSGFYKVIVYVQRKIGLFLDVLKLEDSSYFNNVDLRVIVNLDSEIYFQTEDYFLINGAKEIRYYDGLFYCLVDDDFDKLWDKIEFGKFIFGEDMDNMVFKSIIL